MIRILHIVGGMDRAGAETMVMNIYRNIDRTQIQFDFIYFKEKVCDYDEEIIALGGVIYRITTQNAYQRFRGLVSFFRQHPEYKIVHAHTLLNIGVSFLAARANNIPVRIAHSHNIKSVVDRSWVYNLYESFSIFLINTFSTDFIACSKGAGEYLFRNERNVLVMPNPIDMQTLYKIGLEKRMFLRDNYKIDPSDKIIIQVGRLEPPKNFMFSLKIMKNLKERCANFRFFIVGRGTMENEIRNEIKALGLDDHVTLLGVRDDVPQLMAGADVMLMPSLFEGLPVVLVESQCIGLPAVISENIPADVDMGVSLIKTLSLNQSAAAWADTLVAIKREAPTPEGIEILRSKGLDAKETAKIYTHLYLQK